jgi:hypothetical protein
MTCSWITAANALRRTGQRFYTSLDDLAKTAGVNLSKINSVGSTGQDLKALVQALKKMSVPVEKVTPLSTRLDEVARLAQANRGGVLAFGVNYVQSGQQYGHQLYATFSRLGGLTIVDTTGKVYRSLAGLSQAYPSATLHVPKEAFFVIKNAAIVTGAERAVTVGGLASIVLELVAVSAPAATSGSRGASGMW